MLRTALAVAAILAIAQPVAAAESRSRPFTLVSADGAPVAEARVAIVGRPGSVRTDAKGTFRLDPSVTPPLDLAVFDARGTLLGVVRLDRARWESGEPLVLAPGPEAEVTVRAGLAPGTPAPPAAAATLVTRSDREAEAPARLTDWIATVPGVGTIDEGQTAVPVVRGLARGRTLLLLDDARITAERRAGPSATFLDPFALESVEVVRGPGSVIYGSDALGGVVHARTARPEPGTLGGRWEATAGSGRPVVGGGIALNLPVGDGAILLTGRARRFDDYDAPTGRVVPSGAEDAGASLRAKVPLSIGALDLGFLVDRARDVGKPAAATTPVATTYPREDSARLHLGLDLDPVLGLDGIEVRAFAGRYRLVTRRDRPASSTALRTIQDADVDADDASVRAIATSGIGAGVLRFGVDASGRFGLTAEGTTRALDPSGATVSTLSETSIESARRLTTGAFAEAEHPIGPRVEVAGGVRLDEVRTRNRGGFFGDRSTSNGTVSGYVAATLREGAKRSATLQVARGFRDPSLSDRYFRGVTGRGFATGNPDLRPETSLQWDLSLRSTIPRGHAAVHAYRYRIEDLVERYRSGNDFLFRNRGAERLWGVEAEIECEPRERFVLRAGASYVRGRIEDDRAPAADVPPPSATLALGRRHERFSWEVRGTLVLEKDDPGPTEIRTPGYAVFDLAIRVPLPKGVEVRLRAENLLDRLHPGSADEEAAPAPGRSAIVTLAGTF